MTKEITTLKAYITPDGRVPAKEGRRFAEPYGQVLADDQGSELEVAFLESLVLSFPSIKDGMMREYRFLAPDELWKFDFAWPKQMVGIEIEGGIYAGGRHTRGKGFENDCTKYNTAAVEGWIILRFGPNHVRREIAETLDIVKKALNKRGRAVYI